MAVLLDTHILLWFQSLNNNLSPRHRERIENASEHHYVSYVSLWEIAIKHSIGKLPLDRDLATTFARVEEAGFFPLRPKHILEVGKLPHHHRDPFDRSSSPKRSTKACICSRPIRTSNCTTYRWSIFER